MKLLILTTQDRFFLSHINERAHCFLEKGWKVAVCIQITDNSLVEQIKNFGYEIFDTKIVRKSVNPITQMFSIGRLIKFYFSYKPDIVWHLGAKSIIYGTFVSCLLRLSKPVGIVNAPIGMGWVYASQTMKARILRPLVELLFRLSLNPKNSRVIVENLDDLNYFVNNGSLNRQNAYCIQGAGVDTEKFIPGIRKKKFEYTVVMVARLIREKGVWDFLKAAEILATKKIPVKMQIVGEPDYGNPSSITVFEFESLKKNPAVECLGFRSDIENVLQQADIFCLPSYYREGLPRALIEAASCGLPLLTTDSIGCRDTIKGNNGFLFKKHDVEVLVKQIEYLVQHPEEMLKMGENSRLVALQYFDSKKICKRTCEIFFSLAEDISKIK